MSDSNPLLPAGLNERLAGQPARWLVTGVAGFIGSNLLEALLRAGQRVTGIDNFSTGHRRNLDDVRAAVGDDAWRPVPHAGGGRAGSGRLRGSACAGADYVLHQAALGSVPRSIERPFDSFDSNVAGFLRIMTAARDAGAKRFVYASSSSVYGDSPELPKVEERIGNPLSPYAATKFADEVFAGVYARTYGMRCVGLRYFNVFGPRQDPDGAYAAVIPKWIAALLRGETIYVNGDGQTSRDFCYVANAVQANVLAALSTGLADGHEVFNVAVGERTTLLQVFEAIRALLAPRVPAVEQARVEHRDFRPGDVKHSLADISRARRLLGYEPGQRFADGLALAIGWYCENAAAQAPVGEAPGAR